MLKLFRIFLKNTFRNSLNKYLCTSNFNLRYMINRVIRLGIFGLVAAGFMACDNDDEQKGFRKSMSYNSLDTAVAYSAQFLDESGATTVDLAKGNNLHKMFQGLNR